MSAKNRLAKNHLNSPKLYEKSGSQMSSLYSNSQLTDNYETLSSASLNNQVNLVLKDYEKPSDFESNPGTSTSSMPPFEESSYYASSSDDDRIDQRLKHIEDTAKKGLSKYFEKNVLKFKIKLTFDEPVYLKNDIYINELSMQDSDNDMISIKSSNTETYNDVTETSVTYELEKEHKPSITESESHVKLSLCPKPDIKSEATVGSNLKSTNLEVFNKLSDLVELFTNDDVEESVEVEYETVESIQEEAEQVDSLNDTVEEVESAQFGSSEIEDQSVLPAEMVGNLNNSTENNHSESMHNTTMSVERVTLEDSKHSIWNTTPVCLAENYEKTEVSTRNFDQIVHRKLNTQNFQHLKFSRKSENLDCLKTDNFHHLPKSTQHTSTTNTSCLDEQDIQVEYTVQKVEFSSQTGASLLSKQHDFKINQSSSVNQEKGTLNVLAKSIDCFIQDDVEENTTDEYVSEQFTVDLPVNDFKITRPTSFQSTNLDNDIDIQYLKKLSEIVDSFAYERV